MSEFEFDVADWNLPQMQDDVKKVYDALNEQHELMVAMAELFGPNPWLERALRVREAKAIASELHTRIWMTRQGQLRLDDDRGAMWP